MFTHVRLFWKDLEELKEIWAECSKTPEIVSSSTDKSGSMHVSSSSSYDTWHTNALESASMHTRCVEVTQGPRNKTLSLKPESSTNKQHSLWADGCTSAAVREAPRFYSREQPGAQFIPKKGLFDGFIVWCLPIHPRYYWKFPGPRTWLTNPLSSIPKTKNNTYGLQILYV